MSRQKAIPPFCVIIVPRQNERDIFLSLEPYRDQVPDRKVRLLLGTGSIMHRNWRQTHPQLVGAAEHTRTGGAKRNGHCMASLGQEMANGAVARALLLRLVELTQT